jgi:hypothetical protein
MAKGGAMNTRCLIVIFLTLLSASDPLRAEVYKWTDDSGRIHYSDAPPNVQARINTLPIADCHSQSCKQRTRRESAAQSSRAKKWLRQRQQLADQRHRADRADLRRFERELRELEARHRQEQEELAREESERRKRRIRRARKF